MTAQFIAGANVEGLPISEAVKAGDFIFVSGLIGFEPDGSIAKGITAQTDRIMLDLRDILNRAGATLEHVVKATVFIRDVNDFNDFNLAYARYFPGNKPARVSLVTALTIDAGLEIDFVAYVG